MATVPALFGAGSVTLLDTSQIILVERRSPTFEVSRDFAFDTDRVAVRATWRGGLAVLNPEAISLVTDGVASVADVDKAVSAGPGIRWAVMGPTTLFHLGGGDGGSRFRFRGGGFAGFLEQHCQLAQHGRFSRLVPGPGSGQEFERIFE